MTVTLITSGVVLLLTSTLFLASEFFTFRQHTLSKLAILGDVIAANSTAALAFENQEDAKEVLAALKAESHIVAAALFDKHGKLFAHYPDQLRAFDLPVKPGMTGYHADYTYAIGFQPVVQRHEKQLGTLYLKSDMGALYQQLRLYGAIACLVVVLAFLVAYLLSRKLQKQIVEPVLALAKTVNDVSLRRDYSVRATKHGQDELGVLTDGFNEMLSGIQSRERALREENLERTKAEEGLRKSENQLQTIVENLDEGIVVSGMGGQILHFNRAALEQHGFENLEECQRRLPEFAEIFELATIGGEALPVDVWPLARILRGEKLHNLNLRIRRIGTDWERVFSYGGTLVLDASREPLMAIVTISDITDRVHAEQQIRALNGELERRVNERTAQLEGANKELEAFSYSVSHDLRAPLRHIDGYVEMLTKNAGDALNDKCRRYLKTVSETANEMGQLIDDLLSFSRMGRSEMQRMEVDLELLVQELIAKYESERGTRTIVWKKARLPIAEGDPSMLKQVFVNLLSNAVKYTRRQAVAEIEIGLASETADEAVVFIRDNGAGFDMKYVNKLFGVFQRLHRSAEFEGTGVGLANVRRIIHRHGGRIWAEGVVDGGATFYFTLTKSKKGNEYANIKTNSAG